MARKKLATVLLTISLIAASYALGAHQAPAPTHSHETIHFQCKDCTQSLAAFIAAVTSAQ